MLDHKASRIILGAAVIDDILAMLLAGGRHCGAGRGPASTWLSLLHRPAQAMLFVALVGLVGTRVMRRSSPWLEVPINPLSPLTITLALCLGSGAGGRLPWPGGDHWRVPRRAWPRPRPRNARRWKSNCTRSWRSWFHSSLSLRAREWCSPSSARFPRWAPSLVVTLLAIIGKLVGGGLGALSLGRKNALIVGTGMVPRGEVGIIIANLGWQAGVLDGQMYAILIAMSLLTAIIAPSVLPLLLKPRAKAEEPPRTQGKPKRG